MKTFTWRGQRRPQGAVSFRNLTARFGDGYVQTAGDGINTRGQQWPMEFVGAEAVIKEIKAFLDEHAGRIAFLWTPPLEDEGPYYTPQGYQTTPLGGDAYSLSVTFEQLNKP